MLIALPPKYSVAQVLGFLKGKTAIHMARVYAGRRPITYERGATNFTGQGKRGLVMNFHTTTDEKILVHTGISLVSLADARQNLAVKMKPFGWDFNAMIAHAKTVWNDRLSRVEVSDARPENRKLFYTCIYRPTQTKAS